MPCPTLTKTTPLNLFALSFPFASLFEAESRGVIGDPDGFLNVRAGESDEVAVIVTVGEPPSRV